MQRVRAQANAKFPWSFLSCSRTNDDEIGSDALIIRSTDRWLATMIPGVARSTRQQAVRSRANSRLIRHDQCVRYSAKKMAPGRLQVVASPA